MGTQDDARFEDLLEKFIPTPHGQEATQGPQDAPGDGQAKGGRHPAYIAFDAAVARMWGSGCSPARQRAFEIIRDTLEDSGIPLLRANALAEKCYSALGEIL